MRLDAEYTWTQKRDMLLRISQEVLGGLPLFLPGPWEHEELLQADRHPVPAAPLAHGAAAKEKEGPAKKEGPKRLVGPAEKSLATTFGLDVAGGRLSCSWP